MSKQSFLRQLNAQDAGFSSALTEATAWDQVADFTLEARVREIIQAVRNRGDAAVLEYTARFDRREGIRVEDLRLSSADLKRALSAISDTTRDALRHAAARIRAYHERQLQTSWQYEEADGSMFGQQVSALDRVGVYVPGGQAAYPSSVLMNVVPAKVAGVEQIAMVVPMPDGVINQTVLAAAAIAGVDELYCIGGAQAVAALAYGTERIAAVDKIVGPGNAYVAAAKRQVFGQVGIDMIAGPSEVCVVTDGSADPHWVTLDLFAQAEHDANAQVILVSTDAQFLQRVNDEIERLLPQMTRRDVIAQSLQQRGLLIHVADMQQAIDVANKIAAEHLELAFDDAQAWLPKVRHAGAIFLGHYSAEALGDYCAGPNHVLPTSRSARFFSPLGVYDFQKRSSVISISPQAAQKLAPVAAQLAREEGLQAHALSAEARL